MTSRLPHVTVKLTSRKYMCVNGEKLHMMLSIENADAAIQDLGFRIDLGQSQKGRIQASRPNLAFFGPLRGYRTL